MNKKAIGERGQNCVIGDFAKFDIPVAIPLSDNLPFDLIVYINSKLYKIQVKASSQVNNKGSIEFDLSSNNWYTKTIKLYNENDCDIIACYDLNRNQTYLLSPKEFANKRRFTIRYEEAKNGQTKGMNFHDDYVLSEKRISEVFI
jgi:hypothetical protein